MSDPYIGEIRFFAYVRGAPSGWLTCDGSLQSIAQYESLATLIGTTYGGDGNSQFGLPDLRGRVPIGASPSYQPGNAIGTETVTLTVQQLPAHSHFMEASTVAGTTHAPGGMVYASSTDITLYEVAGSDAPLAMATGAIGVTGQGLPHDNCAPTMPIVACIAYAGVWPPQSN